MYPVDISTNFQSLFRHKLLLDIKYQAKSSCLKFSKSEIPPKVPPDSPFVDPNS